MSFLNAMLPALPLPSIAPGKRYTVPRPAGSGDALLLAHFAQSRKALGQLSAILTARFAERSIAPV